MLDLPGSFNLKWSQVLGFLLGEFVLDDLIDAAAPRSFIESLSQGGQVPRIARGDNLYMAVFGVSHPAAQPNCSSLAMHIPAKPHSLHTPFDEIMPNHKN
jgi:hypothetical protein